MRLGDGATGRGCAARRMVVGSIVAAVALAVAAVPAQATKYFASSFGTTSALSSGTPPTPAGTAYGATFSTGNGGPGDIAVNDPSIVSDGTGQSGWIYVVDRGHNRIQAFDSSRQFKWAIGRDVIASTVNEHQQLTVTATGGQFKLEFNGQTTGDLASNASASVVQTALRALTTINGANVNVTGGPGSASGLTPYVISFVGTLAAADQSQVTVQAGTSPLVGSAAVATVANGTNAVPGNLGDVFEKCTVAVHCKTGSVGTATDGPGGEFNVAQGIDIKQSNGNLYVRERDNRRVQEFTPDGGFVRAWGWNVVQEGTADDTAADEFETCFAAADCQAAAVAGTALGQFASSNNNAATGIAVAPPGSPTAGDIFVADPGPGASGVLSGRRVLRFNVPNNVSSPVVPVAAIGDPGTFGPILGIGQDNPRHVAVDSQGVLYAPSPAGTLTGPGIVRYDTVGATMLPHIDGGGNSPLGVGSVGVSALEVDVSEDRLYVGRSAALGVAEFDLSSKPDNVTAAHLVDVHGRDLAVLPLGLGFASGPGQLLVSTTSTNAPTGAGARVLVLDDTGVDPPAVAAPLPADDVEATTATLRGQVNPNGPTGFPTQYRFQLSKDGITWIDATSNATAGDGAGTVTVEAAVSDLEPNTLYRVRIRTQRDPDAGVTFSPELTFVTDADEPKVETLAPRQVSDSSARLVGRLNPGGIDSEYWFEWGDDSYGKVVPSPAAVATGATPREVGERIDGLDPGAVYHYRLCARNARVDEAVCAEPQTIETRDAADAAADGRAYEMVTAPDKPLRQGHRGDGSVPAPDYMRANPALPATVGTAVRWTLFPGATSGEAGRWLHLGSDPRGLHARSEWVDGAGGGEHPAALRCGERVPEQPGNVRGSRCVGVGDAGAVLRQLHHLWQPAGGQGDGRRRRPARSGMVSVAGSDVVHRICGEHCFHECVDRRSWRAAPGVGVRRRAGS